MDGKKEVKEKGENKMEKIREEEIRRKDDKKRQIKVRKRI